jgi:hypothetical protein
MEEYMRWVRIIVLVTLCLNLLPPINAQQNPRIPATSNKSNIQNSTEPGKKTLTKVIPLDGDIEPIKIVCQSFEQDDEWLKDLTIEIENISGKPIKYLECTTLVCDITGQNCVAIPLVYGKVASKSVTFESGSSLGGRRPEGIYSSQYPNDSKPLQNNNKKTVEAAPLPPKPIETSTEPIPPGGKIKLTVTEGAYNNFKQLISRTGTTTVVNTADLVIGQVHYNDGSGWTNESLLPNSTLGSYKNGNSAFLIDKGKYVWGYLRERTDTYNDIYAGPVMVEDEKGDKSRVQGYSKRVPRSQRVVVFSSGGG